MNKRVTATPGSAAGRSAGPQGTQLFSTDDLRQYACDVGDVADGPASRREPVLEGISEGLHGLRFSLRAGRQTIGRSSDNDIVIEEPSVSSSHGWIINQNGQCVIMNTLSTNGTFVNDKRVHEAVLKHGDHVRLGHAEFAFITHEPGARGMPRWLWKAAAAAALVVLASLAWWLM